MAIYQASTNDAPRNSIVTFFSDIRADRALQFPGRHSADRVVGFVVTLQLPSLAHQMASLDLATVDARILAGLAWKLATLQLGDLSGSIFHVNHGLSKRL